MLSVLSVSLLPVCVGDGMGSRRCRCLFVGEEKSVTDCAGSCH